MSHFTRIKTQMVEREYVIKALDDLGYPYEVANTDVMTYSKQKLNVEITIKTKNPLQHIGLRKDGETYEIVGDWYGVKDIPREKFQQDLKQRYAYHAARNKLEQQGFTLLEEQTEENGRIHLVLRRIA